MTASASYEKGPFRGLLSVRTIHGSRPYPLLSIPEAITNFLALIRRHVPEALSQHLPAIRRQSPEAFVVATNPRLLTRAQ